MKGCFISPRLSPLVSTVLRQDFDVLSDSCLISSLFGAEGIRGERENIRQECENFVTLQRKFLISIFGQPIAAPEMWKIGTISRLAVDPETEPQSAGKINREQLVRPDWVSALSKAENTQFVGTVWYNWRANYKLQVLRRRWKLVRAWIHSG